MSTIDTSTWSPDSSLNTDIGGIPLNSDASIQQTWQAIQILMAALKGDTSAIKLTINQPDGTTIVATDQTLTVVDNGHAHTIANVAGLQTQLDAKAADSGVAHLAGTETVSGDKTFSAALKTSGTDAVVRTANTGAANFCGGKNSAYTQGAKFVAYGASHPTAAGCFECDTGGTAKIGLIGRPNGTLTWNGQNIQTSSDERLKSSLAAVPDAVLDAWEAVEWGQFRYLDAVNRKGESARLHLGLIAQRAKAVFEDRGLDACDYGILCYEQEDDLWMVRYAEAFAMEAAFQRRRADRLEARIAALEEAMR